jgi:MFS superfamily sulfate permease-like transporter
MMHGVWLLLFVTMFPFILRWIPTAALAAILVYTGFKLVNLKVVRELRSYGKSEVLIYFATMIAIVVFDLLTGVIVGFSLSILKLLATFSHLRVWIEDEPRKRRTALFLEGAATFLRLPRLATQLEAVPAGRELHVHFEQLAYIDHACLDLLINWGKQHSATGGSLVIDWESLTARFRQPGQFDMNGNGKNGGHGVSAGPASISGGNGSSTPPPAAAGSQHARSA